MSDLSAFFAMGGYAAFVWPAFGVTAIVLVALLLQSRASLATLEAKLRAMEGLPEPVTRGPVSPVAAAPETRRTA